MKVTKSWLSDYIELSADIDTIAEYLSFAGSETTVTDSREWAKNFGVCLVQTVQKHPNADSLSLCKVLYNNKEYQVVCGGKNVRAGMKTILALPNISVLPGEKEALKKNTIRGIESEGMLCSAEELFLTDVFDNVYDGIIDTEYDINTSLFDILKPDPILELEITPNRGDLLSVIGVAREISALGLGKLINHNINYDNDNIISTDCIMNQTDLCNAFCISELSNVTNSNTETIISKRLRSVGIKTISTLVDITNYIQHEIGRPLHVFDKDKIHGKITIRLSKENEEFLGLDDKLYTLPQGLIVISDEKEIISLAGVLGGKKTACSLETTNIIYESGLFDAKTISFAGRKTNIISDARKRFERCIDPTTIQYGIKKAINMAIELCGGNTSSNTSNIISGFINPDSQVKTKISFDFSNIKKISGVDINIDTAKKRIESIGCNISNDDNNKLSNNISIEIPSWRYDLAIKEDIVEEVLRLGLYKEIKSNLFLYPPVPKPYCIIQKTRKEMVAMDFFESVTFSFMSEKKNISNDNNINIINPISNEYAVLRNSIIPNLIDIAYYHQRKKIEFNKVFEIGPEFSLCSDRQYHQKTMLAGLSDIKDNNDVFDIKNTVENIFRSIGLKHYTLDNNINNDMYHPNISGSFLYNDKIVAKFGILHPKLQKIFDIDGKFGIFEIDLSVLQEYTALSVTKEEYNIPLLNPVYKELSFLIDKETKIGIFIDNILSNANKELVNIKILDIFENDNLFGIDKKSISIRCEFQSYHNTFSDIELYNLMDAIIEKSKSLGAIIRGSWE